MLLKQRMLPVLQAIQRDTEGRCRALASASAPNLTIPQEEWEGFRNTLLALNDEQLEKGQEKLIELYENMILQAPDLRKSILILGFSKVTD
jgi:hypothetical protein